MYQAPSHPSWMVGQGKRLDDEDIAKLEDVAADETAVMIPVETVLRAAGLYLAEHGRPAVMEQVQAFLDEQRKRAAA